MGHRAGVGQHPPPPIKAVLGFQIDWITILNVGKIVDKLNAWPTLLQGPKIQYGRRSPGTVILTFILWEIRQYRQTIPLYMDFK